MEVLLSVLLGIGLSAACGFRVFVPPLVLSVATLAGHVHLAHGFQWIGTWPALIAFGVATALEITAYYVPWMDNLLDTVATPAAVVAGIVVTASCVSEMSPLLRWSLAVIAGGGVAGVVQVLTVKARLLSSFFTLGTGNPVVSTVENVSSATVSVLSVLLPVLAVLALALIALLVWLAFRKRASSKLARSG